MEKRSAIALALGLLGASDGPWGATTCDVVFRDVAQQSPVVLLVEFDGRRGDEAVWTVIEVLKGPSGRETLRFGPHELDLLRPSTGDRFLLALTERRALVRRIQGMGSCVPISALPLRGGRLSPTDRVDYDGTRKAMDLDELRRDLAFPPRAN